MLTFTAGTGTCTKHICAPFSFPSPPFPLPSSLVHLPIYKTEDLGLNYTSATSCCGAVEIIAIFKCVLIHKKHYNTGLLEMFNKIKCQRLPIVSNTFSLSFLL